MIKYDTLDGDGTFKMFSPVCTPCKHKISAWPRTCKAFSEGIPDEIWLGENDHTKPYPGDHGILYQRRLPPPLSGYGAHGV